MIWQEKGIKMERTAQKHRKYFVVNMEYKAEGVYYTKVLDSQEPGMVWHRLLTDGGISGEISRTVEVCASDVSCAESGGELEGHCQAEFDNPGDVLLFGVKGRYLWLKITVKRKTGVKPVAERILIYFPKHTWLTYLPEIYGDDQSSASFLERYLGIFQSLYEDMTERIEKSPSLLEPSADNRDMLYELADWFAIEGRTLWDDSQLLYLVRNAWRIRMRRGTAECLRELVKLYIGKEPYIVEYHQIKPYFDGERRERLLKKLYCSNGQEFAVLIDDESAGEKNRFLGLKQVVDMAKPAHMESRIIVLKPYIFLDQHSYLGINSVLGRYRLCCLDGLCAIPFSVIAGEEKG